MPMQTRGDDMDYLRWGANEPCWCGSGKKFKKCHYNRTERPPVSLSDAHLQFKKAVHTKRCLHWDAGINCDGGAIRAHGVQKNGHLSRIARAGEVYVFDESLPRIAKNQEMAVCRKGISVAGTFNGFCAKHDSATFAPLEQVPYACTRQQVALLGYRAICKEVLGKLINKSLVPTLREADRGKPVGRQIAHQDRVSNYEFSLDAGGDDAMQDKQRIEQTLKIADFSNLHCCCIYTDVPPPVAFSYSWLIECDFAGNRLQEAALRDPNARPDSIWVATVSTESGGAVVFGWIGGSQIALQLVESLVALPTDRIPDACLRFAFEFALDCCIAPDWWDQMTPEDRHLISRRRTTAVNPFEERKPSCLADDGMSVANFRVTGIERDFGA